MAGKRNIFEEVGAQGAARPMLAGGLIDGRKKGARRGIRLWLVETFVDPTRFTGTAYRAANWLALGQTAGHGKQGHGWNAGRDGRINLLQGIVDRAPLDPRQTCNRLCRGLSRQHKQRPNQVAGSQSMLAYQLSRPSLPASAAHARGGKGTSMK